MAGEDLLLSASWLGDAWPVPSAPVQPSAEEKLRWAAESALSGDVSMFEPYRPPDPWRATYEPLPAIELDLSTAPGAPLDWWLAPTEEYAGSPRPQAVYRLARQIELVDWLQTAVTRGVHAPAPPLWRHGVGGAHALLVR